MTTELTDCDLNFIATGLTDDLRETLKWAREQGDNVYAHAIAKELLQRERQEEQAKEGVSA